MTLMKYILRNGNTVNSFYSDTFYRNTPLLGTLLAGPTGVYYLLYMVEHFL